MNVGDHDIAALLLSLVLEIEAKNHSEKVERARSLLYILIRENFYGG
jgi:hypothetical protein